MSVSNPTLYALYIQPAPACATTSTAAVSLTAMTAGIPITASVTVRDSYGNLRVPNSYSASPNMDNVLAVLYSLPAPLTPTKNFLNGYTPSGNSHKSQHVKLPQMLTRFHQALPPAAAAPKAYCRLTASSSHATRPQTCTQAGRSTPPSPATTSS
jgi:hypothetical protein